MRAIVDEAAAARRWLDVARGTLDDFAWRSRRGERESIKNRPLDRESALSAVREVTEVLRLGFITASADEPLAKQLDALAADMESDGPLRHRVDGRELVGDVERALAAGFATSLPPGGLLSVLDKRAHQEPPLALLTELRAVVEAMKPAWRSMDL
jgi:hypothetical protein